MLTAQLTQNKQQKGFTLIELLVVIGILAILLAIVLIAINPARQFGQANNTRRQSDVTQVLNAVGAYEADNAGKLPSVLSGTADNTFIDARLICADILPNYIPSLPVDPTINNGAAFATCADADAGPTDTAYQVEHDSSGHVTVKASITDNSAVITNTR